MYKSIIISNPTGGVDTIPAVIQEINARGEKIVSFAINHAHYDPADHKNIFRSFIWIVEVPEPTESI